MVNNKIKNFDQKDHLEVVHCVKFMFETPEHRTLPIKYEIVHCEYSPRFLVLYLKCSLKVDWFPSEYFVTKNSKEIKDSNTWIKKTICTVTVFSRKEKWELLELKKNTITEIFYGGNQDFEK